MPPVSRFGGGGAEKKQGVIDKLRASFENYFGFVLAFNCDSRI
jgi:hypothetical protein